LGGARLGACVAALYAAIAVGATPRVAAADHCHSLPPEPGEREPRGIGLRVWASFEAATYDNPPYVGSYLGVALGASFERGPVKVWAVMPGYRLLRSGQTFVGVGDLLTAARLAVIEDEAQTSAAGLGMGATWPSGDRARDLGMGHVMVMPGLWGAWRGVEAFVDGDVSYARALASSADHSAHRFGAPIPRPLVAPMNASEAAARLAAGYFLLERFRVRASLYGAIPIADEHGVERFIASAGADWIAEAFDVGLEGHLPVAGDPFTFKIVLRVGGRF
jgi:hypothetical protein